MSFRPVPRQWIRSAEVRGDRRLEKGNTTTTVSVCLLLFWCQHLQSANKIITTVNSDPLIG